MAFLTKCLLLLQHFYQTSVGFSIKYSLKYAFLYKIFPKTSGLFSTPKHLVIESFWIYDTFINNFKIKHELGKYLRRSCQLGSPQHFSIKYFLIYSFIYKIFPKTSGFFSATKLIIKNGLNLNYAAGG